MTSGESVITGILCYCSVGGRGNGGFYAGGVLLVSLDSLLGVVLWWCGILCVCLGYVIRPGVYWFRGIGLGWGVCIVTSVVCVVSIWGGL